MHRNRQIYTYSEYQTKLRNGYKKLGVLLLNKKDKSCYVYRPVPSTAWLPEGRKKYFRKLQRRFETINKSKKYTFLTLTYSTKLYSPEEVAQRVKSDIDKFLKRLDYHHKRFEYFYVIELTNKLYCHIHFICAAYIPAKKIKASWYAITGSYITKIKALPTKQAFYYALKYLSDCKKQQKGKWAFIFKHIDRIWSSSRGFFGPVANFEKSFEFLALVSDYSGKLNPLFLDPEQDFISTAFGYDIYLYIIYKADEPGHVHLIRINSEHILTSENEREIFNNLQGEFEFEEAK